MMWKVVLHSRRRGGRKRILAPMELNAIERIQSILQNTRTPAIDLSLDASWLYFNLLSSCLLQVWKASQLTFRLLLRRLLYSRLQSFPRPVGLLPIFHAIVCYQNCTDGGGEEVLFLFFFSTKFFTYFLK